MENNNGMDIQSLVTAVKNSRKYTDRVLTNVLSLPSELLKCEEQIVWAKATVPAAYVMDEGPFCRYYFFTAEGDASPLMLPESSDKTIICEMYGKAGSEQALRSVHEKLLKAGFVYKACFQRMNIRRDQMNMSGACPAEYSYTMQPSPADACALWNAQIADITGMPDEQECREMIDRQLVFAVEKAGELAAAMMLEKAGKRYTVRHVAVSPQHRRKGLGRYLMQQALGQLPEDALTMLWVEKDNVSAVRLYESMGFVADGMRSVQWIHAERG